MEECDPISEPVPLQMLKPSTPKSKKKPSSKVATASSVRGKGQVTEGNLTSSNSDQPLKTLKQKRK
ncbi:hypothetical protein Dimus_005608, partial [Dionaea muscipula]